MTEFFEMGYGKNEPRVKMGAEYRFVPLASKIVPSPLCKPGTGHGETPELSHLLPVPGGFSGVLTVSLFSDGTRPFLFGQQELVTDPPMPEPTPITRPASDPISGKDTRAIPGRAARGMIKSVFRIATCSALEPVNKHHRFGDRDFEYLALRGVKLRELSRGWLVPRKKARSEGNSPTSYEWSIHPALSTTIDKIPFEELASALTNEDAGGREYSEEIQFWQGKLRIDKKPQDCGIQKRRDKYKRLINSGFEGTLEQGAFLIITGPMAKKEGEAVFGKPNEDRTLPGPNYREDMQRIMADFLHIHSDYSNDGAIFAGGAKRAVTGNFRLFLIDHAKFVEDKCGRRDALALLRSHGLNEKDLGEAIRPKGMPGVPVYYTRDSEGALVFGTAQVFSVAHSFDVGGVHSRRPKRDTEFDTSRFTDWTDGLFGTIKAWSEAGAGDGARQVPLASRVRFGFGTLVAGTPELMPRTAVVQGAPKASFQMYYLWETEPDTNNGLKGSWSSETVVLAGHKRYPAVRPYNGLGGKPFKGEKPDKTEALVQPLKGAATFDVPIRFDNLHPLELGALLWSVSFGDRQVFAAGGGTRYRHLGGRLRNKGLGRFEPKDARLSLRQNPMPEGLRIGDISDKIENQADALMLAFETFMGQRFRCAYPTDVISPNLADHEAFYTAPPIRALLNMSDANWGADRDDAKLDARFRLPETTVNGETKADFTAFMQLRRALYMKGRFPANSPYKRPIHHVLDDFFDERPLPDMPHPDREGTIFKAFYALLDPLGALRDWRSTQSA